MDWGKMFLPDAPLLEIIIRGTVTYLSLFTLLRIILRRESGGDVGMTDVLVLVLIADAAQNAMAGGYHSITDGVVLVAVIICWSYLLNWLSYHWSFFYKLIRPSKLLLAENGKMLRRNMRKELITAEELMMALREEGFTSLEEVEKVFMESDGTISVMPKKNRREVA
jgi:uncharacterized membrane protein YcaP (DUF421 family)